MTYTIELLKSVITDRENALQDEKRRLAATLRNLTIAKKSSERIIADLNRQIEDLTLTVGRLEAIR